VLLGDLFCPGELQCAFGRVADASARVLLEERDLLAELLEPLALGALLGLGGLGRDLSMSSEIARTACETASVVDENLRVTVLYCSPSGWTTSYSYSGFPCQSLPMLKTLTEKVPILVFTFSTFETGLS
jgi:hypothetical protein